MKIKAITPKLKLIVLMILAILAIVLILQNREMVDTRLLFVTVSMPVAALLALTLLLGFAGGVLVAMKVGNRHGRKPAEKMKISKG